MLLAVGRAVPAADAAPYRPLTEAMLRVLRERPMPDDESLRPWLPGLSAIIPSGGGGHGEASNAARGEAVIRLLRTLSGENTAVMVLEDLHWADPDTLEVVEYLAGNLTRERILCVITVRSEARSAGLELIRRLRGVLGVVHLPLKKLDEDQVEQMVRSCLPAASDRLLARVTQSAEGIPLLVEELLASPGVPRSFSDTVAARLAEFSAEERLVVEAAALFGRSFDWHLLPDTTGLGPDTVAASLERAVDCLLVTVDENAFRFRHALTREAVVEAMPPPRRAQLAARALAAVEAKDPDLGEGTRELAADLAAQAGDVNRAGILLAASGRVSVERGALATAVETLLRSIPMLGGSPGLITEAERTLVEAFALAGRVDEAVAIGNRLIASLRDRGDTAQVAEIHLRLAHAAVSATRWPVAVIHLDAAKELLATETPSALGATVAVLEAEVALATDDVERSRQLATAALATAGVGADDRCHAFEILGRSERLNDLAAARRTFESALSTAEENGLEFWRLRALHELGTVEMFERGGPNRLYEARVSAAGLGALSTVAVIDLQLAAALDAEFALDAGAAHARESLELSESLGLDQVKTKALYFLAENHTYRLDRSEMERHIALARSAGADDPAGEGFAWGARGTLAFLEDDWSGALDALGRAIGIFAELPHAEPANFRSLWPLLLAHAADERAEPALEQARRAGIDRAFANRGILGYAEAIIVGRDDPSRATQLALEADADLTFSGPWGHFPRLCAAESARSDRWGDPERWLHTAADCFAVHGLEQLVARCRQLLDAEKPNGWTRLRITARETDVLELVTAGLNNRDIAARLQLSPRTVEKHVESLMRKTGARSRTQLAIAATARNENPPRPRSGNPPNR
jgi:DNA-binding CsgD family transcriptional regulator/tetratricopeptide (TPR) repeat protein